VTHDPHRLSDLTDRDRLQRVCDGLSGADGIALAVLDPDGTVLVASGRQDICTRFHRHHEATLAACLESDLRMTQSLAEGTDAPAPSARRCANGLWDAAFPLVVDGEHLATLSAGQFFYDDDEIDEAAFRERARRLGFDEPACMDALARVPVLSHERVEQTIGFLADLVGLLAETGLGALQRERERESLRESEERYRALFDRSLDLVYLHDFEGRFLAANPAALDLLGYEREEIVALSFAALLDDGQADKVLAVLAELRETGSQKAPTEYRLRRKTGEYVDVETKGSVILRRGQPYAVLGIGRDVTGRKLTEEALRLSEDKFSKAFHGSPDAILITRASDGLITDVNDGFVKLSGFTRDEAVGSSTIALDLWADSRDRDRLISALRTGGSVRDLEFDFRVKSGDVLQCFIAGADIDVGGEPHILTVVRDVTEQRRAEAEILRLNAELEQRVAARTAELEAANAELESFAYSVSHDLRAPLRALDGFSKILLDDYGPRLDEEGRSHLDRIRAADQRMGTLIDALLELSRLNRGELQRERLDLSELARRVAAELAETEPARTVELRIAEGLEARADTRLARALLANLLGNAWKFTARHETARIEVGAAEGDGADEHVFFVRDDGAGFDMAYSDKLFGAFQRLHSTSEFPGLGIGLATVKRIVRRHGGRVWAEGAVEKGATFFFTLPETARAGAAGETPSRPASALDTSAGVGEDAR